MRLGYNTNGFTHHRLEDALDILAELGYQSVAITLDYHALDPLDPELDSQIGAVRQKLEQLNLACVVETGARFLLDPRRKHQPTLISPDETERDTRLVFLRDAVDIAGRLGAQAVSFWSGAPTTDEPYDVLFGRLLDGCQSLADYAAEKEMPLAFEPEPGMLIDTLDRYRPLHALVESPWFGVTIDIGHLHCMDEVPIPDKLREWKELLWNVHIEDMRRGIHEHLLFGDGEIEFGPVLSALAEIGYQGGVHVELSRHTYDAVEAARRSWDFLFNLWPTRGA